MIYFTLINIVHIAFFPVADMAPHPISAVSAKLADVAPHKPPKVSLQTVSAQITCHLCKGYLIDATTIVECLHSCKYLDKKTNIFVS